MENFLVVCVIQVYRKHAANDDLTANLYLLIGYPGWAYRKTTIQALKLKPGHSLFGLACSPGIKINSPLYQGYIPLRVEIFGVNISDSILTQPKKRVEICGWKNNHLVRANVAAGHHPHPVDVVISPLASFPFSNPQHGLDYMPNTLNPFRRMVLPKLQLPVHCLSWIIAAARNLLKLFAVKDGQGIDKPWETIQREKRSLYGKANILQRYFYQTNITSGKSKKKGKHCKNHVIFS